MAIRIQLRRDTAANWTSTNPVLRQGEIGIETDTLQMKLGDGTSTWTQIAGYMNLVPDGNLTIGDYVMVNDISAANGVVGLDSNKNAIIPGTSIIVEGETDNSFETTLTVTDPTADRTITFPNATGTVALTSDLPTQYTDELAQDATAAALAAGTHTNITVTYNDVSNSLSLAAAPGYVDEQAVDAVAAALAAGTHTNITVGYNDAGNAISLTGAVTYTDENAQDAIGNAVGTGLSYNDTTGAISVDTSTIQARVANVTDTEIGYLDGVTSAIQTQIDSKASSASPTFTGTATLSGTGDFVVNGTSNIRITPADGSNAYIGTASADNIITTAGNTQTLTNKSLTSPALTGVPTAPTASAGTNTTQVATTAFVGTAVSNLVASAPEALNTLNELATALGNDASFSTTITNSIGLKAPIASPTFTGTVAGITKSMVGLGDVDNTTDAAKPISTATQTALDLKLTSTTAASTYAPLASPTFTGTVAGITKSMVGLGDVDNTTDANKPISTATQTALDLKLASATAASTYAPLANPTFTGTTTLGGTGDFLLNGNSNIRITPAAGSNVYIGTAVSDNIITTAGNTQTLTNKSLTSPALTGTPTAPLAATGTNTTQIATTSFVQQELNILTTGAPAALNTLDELAAALGDDANYAATITTALGNKVNNNYVTIGNTLLEGVSGQTYGLIGTSTYLDVKNTNGYNKEIELDIAAVESKLDTDGYVKQAALDLKLTSTTAASTYAPLASPTFTGTVAAADLTISGNLTVNGTTTTLNSTTISVDDKNIELGSVATPSDVTADGGGITLKGTTDKTFNWVDSTDAWTSSEHINLASGKSLYLNGTLLKDATETLTNKTLISPVITGTPTLSGTGDFLINGDTNIRLVPASGSNAYVGTLSANNIITTAGNTQTLTNKTLSAGILTGTLTAGGSVGTSGQLLTSTVTGVTWADAPVSLPSQTGNSGKYLTTDGSSATWGTLVIPITTSTSTISANTATTVDTTALSAFTSIEYMVSLKQGSKIRTSKVIVQTDGTSVDMTEFAITETGGTIAGVIVSAAVSSTNGVLQITATDAVSTNVTAKIVKVVI